MARRKLTPRTAKFDTRQVARKQESFNRGSMPDIESLDIPNNGVQTLINARGHNNAIKGCIGSKKWIDGLTLEPRNSGTAVTRTTTTIAPTDFTPAFDLNDLDETYIGYTIYATNGANTELLFIEDIHETTKVMTVNGLDVSGTVNYTDWDIVGKINARYYDQTTGTEYMLIGVEIYYRQIDSTTWSKYFIIDSDDIVNAESQFFKIESRIVLNNLGGNFVLSDRFNGDQYAYKANGSLPQYPLDSQDDAIAPNLSVYRYIYGYVRQKGDYTLNRNSEETYTEIETPAFLRTGLVEDDPTVGFTRYASDKDYTQIKTARPIESTFYHKYTISDERYKSYEAWKELTEDNQSPFMFLTYKTQNNKVFLNFGTVESMNDVADAIERSLYDVDSGFRVHYNTDGTDAWFEIWNEDESVVWSQGTPGTIDLADYIRWRYNDRVGDENFLEIFDSPLSDPDAELVESLFLDSDLNKYRITGVVETGDPVTGWYQAELVDGTLNRTYTTNTGIEFEATYQSTDGDYTNGGFMDIDNGYFDYTGVTSLTDENSVTYTVTAISEADPNKDVILISTTSAPVYSTTFITADIESQGILTYGATQLLMGNTISTFRYPTNRKDITHYSVYRTKDIFPSISNIPNFRDERINNNPERYAWIQDIPVVGTISGTVDSGASTLTVASGDEDTTIIGETLKWGDVGNLADTIRIDSLNGLVYSYTVVSGSISNGSYDFYYGTDTARTLQKTSGVTSGGYAFGEDDIGKCLFWADGSYDIIKSIDSSKNAVTVDDGDKDSQLAFIDPTERVYYDTADSITFDANLAFYPYNTRYYKPLPNTNIATYHNGIFACGVRDTNAIEYCQVSNDNLRNFGYHHSIKQVNDKIDKGIRCMFVVNDLICVLTTSETHHFNPKQAQVIEAPEFGEYYLVINDPFLVHSAIGATHQFKWKYGEKGDVLIITNEPAVRFFNGQTYDRNLADGYIQHTELQKMGDIMFPSYSSTGGIHIWGELSG